MHPLLRRRLIGFLGCGAGAVSIAIGLVGKRGEDSGGDVQLGVVVLLVGLAFALAGFADEEGLRRVQLASVVALLGVIVGGIVGTIIGQFQHPEPEEVVSANITTCEFRQRTLTAGTDVIVLEVTVDEPMALVVVEVGTSVIDQTPVGTARFDDLQPGETYTARFTTAGEILGAIDCYAELKTAEF